MKIFIFIFAVIGFANGQANRTCTHTRLVTPNHFFQLDKIVGKWYAVEIYSGLTVDASPLNFECLEANFIQTRETELVKTEIYNEIPSGKNATTSYNVSVVDPVGSIWEINPNTNQTSDIVWLQTDYENWAVQFECSVVENYRYEKLSIWSRERAMDSKTSEIMRFLATGYGFPRANARSVIQTSCDSQSNVGCKLGIYSVFLLIIGLMITNFH